SAYAKTCYERFNFFKASFLTAKRILTCNPLFKSKYDPVPEKKDKQNKNTTKKPID
ncbi:MAG: membrane protein insertion efficiency factor YidD, partial [Acholeplasmataceae bacterium]|nr:membrane protein insertion efficiency factor YidD [Acholeplasmataceae bacterium]